MIVRFAEDLWTDDYRTITDAIVASVATGPHNLARLAEASFERRGDYPALLFEDRWYGSGELFERSCRLAAGLAELGIAPGERVVVTMANCPEVGIALPGAVARRRGRHPRHVPAAARGSSPRDRRRRGVRGDHHARSSSTRSARRSPGSDCVRFVISQRRRRWRRARARLARAGRPRVDRRPRGRPTWRRCCTRAARRAAPRA